MIWFLSAFPLTRILEELKKIKIHKHKQDIVSKTNGTMYGQKQRRNNLTLPNFTGRRSGKGKNSPAEDSYINASVSTYTNTKLHICSYKVILWTTTKKFSVNRKERFRKTMCCLKFRFIVMDTFMSQSDLFIYFDSRY